MNPPTGRLADLKSLEITGRQKEKHLVTNKPSKVLEKVYLINAANSRSTCASPVRGGSNLGNHSSKTPTNFLPNKLNLVFHHQRESQATTSEIRNKGGVENFP